MDPVTHAASGAIAMLAFKNRPVTAWAWPLAAIACASPDIDLAFIHTPLEFLEIHRGITHSFAGMPFLALILAVLAWPLWRKSTKDHWPFLYVWFFCCAMVLLHIWLDVVTTYGTMVFLPFSHYRVRLNSIFIIDLIVTIPILWALWRWRTRRGLILLTLLWTFIYPASGILINHWHSSQWEERFKAEGRNVKSMHVLPDAFTPFFWRLIFEENTGGVITVREQSLNVMGNPRAPEVIYQAAPAPLVDQMKEISTDGEVFFDFTVLPVMKNLPAEHFPENEKKYPNSVFLMFHDLRFGSGLGFVRRILAMRPDADIPFQLMAQISSDSNINSKGENFAHAQVEQMRLRFSDSGRDSQWHAPHKMQKPDFFQWLFGLR